MQTYTIYASKVKNSEIFGNINPRTIYLNRKAYYLVVIRGGANVNLNRKSLVVRRAKEKLAELVDFFDDTYYSFAGSFEA